MTNIKKVQTYQNRKYFIPLIVICILSIITYCYEEYYSLEVKNQLLPAAYSQPPCNTVHQNKASSMDSKDDFIRAEFPIDIVGNAVRENLMNVKITPVNPSNAIICHDMGGKRIYSIPPSQLEITISSKKLKDTTTTRVSSPLDFNINPRTLKNIIDEDGDGVLNSIDTYNNKVNQPTTISEPNTNCRTIDPTILFECERGKTNLIIQTNGQDLILGASKDPNGIIVITENTPKPTSALIHACKENFIYDLPKNRALEIICK